MSRRPRNEGLPDPAEAAAASPPPAPSRSPELSDALDSEESGTALAPLESAGSLAPAKDIAAALKMQAEILKRLHQQQQKMGEALADTRRSELVIQSTQALNDSFSGMKRVQEKLLDRLDEKRAGNKALPWILGAAGVALTAAVVWGVQQLGERVEKTGSAMKSSNDGVVSASLDALDRLSKDSTLNRELIREELSNLRTDVARMSDEKAKLVAERDRAREELGEVRIRMERIEGDSGTQRTRAEVAEREVARLTERSLAEQRLLQELNKTLDGMRAAATRPAPPPAPVSSGTTPPATSAQAAPARPESARGETARTEPAEKTVEPSGEPAPSSSTQAVSPAGAGTEAAPAVPAAAPTSSRPVTPAFLDEMNALLSKHRSSDVYVLVSAKEWDSAGLKEVVLEVRGRDGSVSKTVEAARLEAVLSSRGAMVELTFDTGFVHFHQSAGRDVKSPFFNNRYQILVIGIDPQAWLQANLPFVKVK